MSVLPKIYELKESQTDSSGNISKICRICANFSGKHGQLLETASLTSKASGCNFCAILSDSIDELVPELYTQDPSHVLHSYKDDATLSLYSPNIFNDFLIRIFSKAIQSPFGGIVTEPLSSGVPNSTDSAQSFSWATAKLQECIDSHGYHCSPLSVARPTRLLHVGGTNAQSVQVVNSQGIREPYTALSHCWGNEADITAQLTSETISKYYEEISLGQLPLTFQHAVQFTRGIGVSYIWIDSLCIIQGDEDDWRRESANMHNIYQGSYLTIAATASKNGGGGLYQKRKKLDVLCEYQKGLFCRLTVERGIRHFSREDASNKLHQELFPLLTRGWAYQEMMLSPRVLHFATDELLWECRHSNSTVICQCGYNNQQRSLPSLSPRCYLTEPQSDSPWGHSTHWQRIWRRILSQYTSLNLSNETDKLPALSGIAQGMMSLSPSAIYLAGLWEHTLVYNLRWLVPVGAVKLPPQRRYITWSWVSVSSNIIMHDPGDESLVTAEDFRIQSASCEYAGGYNTGEATSGELTVEGVTYETTVGKLRERSRQTFSDMRLRYRPDYDFDTPGERRIGANQTVHCLKVAVPNIKDTDGSKRGRMFIILRSVDDSKQVYERIGLLDFWRQRPFTSHFEKLDPVESERKFSAFWDSVWNASPRKGIFNIQ